MVKGRERSTFRSSEVEILPIDFWHTTLTSNPGNNDSTSLRDTQEAEARKLYVDVILCRRLLSGVETDQSALQTRVNEIRDFSLPVSWNVCPGSLNPVDLPSRGISGQELSNASLWFSGHEILAKDK